MKSWTEADHGYMARALSLARSAPGRVSPNPRVGAVVVRGGRVVGAGAHRGAGQAHAEVVALDRAGARARGATLYLNLEPCAHWGRTPPCVEAIVEAGVARVVCSLLDPDRRVKGRGVRALRRAGVRVEVGLGAEEAEAVNRAYLHARRTGRPWVMLKLALTLDGKIADADGASRWVTGPASRRLGHRMRREADFVVVGRRTVEADEPRLDVRLVSGPDPGRIVLDSRLRLDPRHPFFTTRAPRRGARVSAARAPRREARAGAARAPRREARAGAARAPRTVVATSAPAGARRARELVRRGVEIWRVRADRTGRVDVASFLRRAAKEEATRLLVEGGGEVAGSFLRARCVDEVALFYGPRVLGEGGRAHRGRAPRPIPGFGDVGVKDLAGALRIVDARWRRLGEDLLLVGRPAWPARPARRAARGGSI